jgi:hypothetical protein
MIERDFADSIVDEGRQIWKGIRIDGHWNDWFKLHGIFLQSALTRVTTQSVPG